MIARKKQIASRNTGCWHYALRYSIKGGSHLYVLFQSLVILTTLLNIWHLFHLSWEECGKHVLMKRGKKRFVINFLESDF